MFRSREAGTHRRREQSGSQCIGGNQKHWRVYGWSHAVSIRCGAPPPRRSWVSMSPSRRRSIIV